MFEKIRNITLGKVFDAIQWLVWGLMLFLLVFSLYSYLAKAKASIPSPMTGIVKFFLPENNETILVVSQGWSSGFRCDYFINEVIKNITKAGGKVQEQTCKKITNEE